MKTFELEVITPERQVYKGAVRSLVVPAEGGSLGVLAHHAPLLCPIEIGEAKLVDEGGETLFFMVSPGFLEVEHQHARLLLEAAERAGEIDEERAERARERAQKRLQEASRGQIDLVRARMALLRATVRLKIRQRMGARRS